MTVAVAGLELSFNTILSPSSVVFFKISDFSGATKLALEDVDAAGNDSREDGPVPISNGNRIFGAAKASKFDLVAKT